MQKVLVFVFFIFLSASLSAMHAFVREDPKGGQRGWKPDLTKDFGQNYTGMIPRQRPCPKKCYPLQRLPSDSSNPQNAIEEENAPLRRSVSDSSVPEGYQRQSSSTTEFSQGQEKPRVIWAAPDDDESLDIPDQWQNSGQEHRLDADGCDEGPVQDQNEPSHNYPECVRQTFSESAIKKSWRHHRKRRPKGKEFMKLVNILNPTRED